MTGCCVPFCTGNSEKGIRVFRFPRERNRRKIWELQVKRDSWEARDTSRICEVESRRILLHGHDACVVPTCGDACGDRKPAKLFDDTNPDWAPSLHLGYSSGEGPGVKGRSKSAEDPQLHFESSQFEQGRVDGWKKLKYNAVPTLFPCNTKAIKQETQQGAPSKRRKMQHKVKTEEPDSSDSGEAICKPEALASFCEVILTYENYSSDIGTTTVTVHQIPEEDEPSTPQ